MPEGPPSSAWLLVRVAGGSRAAAETRDLVRPVHPHGGCAYQSIASHGKKLLCSLDPMFFTEKENVLLNTTRVFIEINCFAEANPICLTEMMVIGCVVQ